MVNILQRFESYFATRKKRKRYQTMSREEVFADIFFNKTWTANLLHIPVSGVGSTVPHTHSIRKEIEQIIKTYNIQSIVDVGCGDFNWMREVNLGKASYTGTEIVNALVETNQKYFGNTQRKFLSLDICEETIPAAELVICRDCLVHLCLAEVEKAFANIRRANCRYFLATTFSGINENKEIVTGLWRPINLELPPFNFPPPLHYILEDGQDAAKSQIKKQLGFWKLERI